MGKNPMLARGSGALPTLTGGGALTVTTTVGLTLTMHSQKTQPNGQMKTVMVTGITPLLQKIRMTVQRNPVIRRPLDESDVRLCPTKTTMAFQMRMTCVISKV